MLIELDEFRNEFRLTDTPSKHHSLSVSQLFDPEFCRNFLNQVVMEIDAPSTTVAASIFSKRYVYSLLIPTLWMLSVHDKALHIEIENCYIETVNEEGRWVPHLRLADWSYDTAKGNREYFREQLLTLIMRDHLAPLWQQLNQESRIPIPTLWENTATYIYWLYQVKMREHLTSEMFYKAQEDYLYLVHVMEAERFAERIQPLQRFLAYIDQQERKRKTCCLSYQVGGEGRCCSICPHRCKIEKKREQEVALS